VSAFGAALVCTRNPVNFPRVDAKARGDQMGRSAEPQHLAGKVGLTAIPDPAAPHGNCVERNPCEGIESHRHTGLLAVAMRGEGGRSPRHNVGAAFGTGAALTGVSVLQALTPFVSRCFLGLASDFIAWSSRLEVVSVLACNNRAASQNMRLLSVFLSRIVSGKSFGILVFRLGRSAKIKMLTRNFDLLDLLGPVCPGLF
jgi:hypothetical protein